MATALHVEFLQAFSGSQAFVALICSLPLCMQVAVGPVSGMLSDVLSHRVTIMAGGAMRSVALLSASFSPDLSTLLILFGVLAGLGAGLCFTPCATIVCTYFHKYRTVANGIILGAPGLGFLAGSYLLGWLMDGYGWRYAMAAHAGLMAQTCILGALFYSRLPASVTAARCCHPCRGRPPSGDDPAVSASGTVDMKDTSSFRPQIDDQQSTEQEIMLASATHTEVKSGSGSRTERQIVTESLTELRVKMGSRTELAVNTGSRTNLKVGVGSRTGPEVKVGSETDLESQVGSRTDFHSGTILNKSGSVVLNQSLESLEEQEFEPKRLSFRLRIIRLLCQRPLWIICVNQLLMVGSMSIHIVLFPAFARSVGAASHDIPELYTAYGLSLSVARLTGGFVFSAIPGCLVHVLFGLQVAQAVAFVFLPVYGTSLPALFVGCVSAGVTFGPSFVLLSPILLHYVPVSDLSMAFGLVMLCCSAAIITGPSVAGLTYDISHSHSASYYIAGSTVGAGALLLLLLLFVKDLQPPGVKDDKEDNLLTTNQKDVDRSAGDTEHETACGNSCQTDTECQQSSEHSCDVTSPNSKHEPSHGEIVCSSTRHLR